MLLENSKPPPCGGKFAKTEGGACRFCLKAMGKRKTSCVVQVQFQNEEKTHHGVRFFAVFDNLNCFCSTALAVERKAVAARAKLQGLCLAV